MKEVVRYYSHITAAQQVCAHLHMEQLFTEDSLQKYGAGFTCGCDMAVLSLF